MTRAARQAIRFSEHADPARDIRRARRAGLFDSLADIYAEFPETACENCARCCFESPGIFFVEYLNLLHLLAQLPRPPREALLDRAFGELFFSWIDAQRTCIFLESSHCTIYDHRPFACRLFGLAAPENPERAEAQARLAARREAERLRLFGIEIPEAVIQRSLVSCGRVRDGRGRHPRVDGDPIAARVAQLDSALLPREIVLQELCFRSLPERLGAAALGAEVIDGLRIQLLRRAQRGEPIPDLLRLLRRQARLPAPLTSKARKQNR